MFSRTAILWSHLSFMIFTFQMLKKQNRIFTSFICIREEQENISMKLAVADNLLNCRNVFDVGSGQKANPPNWRRQLMPLPKRVSSWWLWLTEFWVTVSWGGFLCVCVHHWSSLGGWSKKHLEFMDDFAHLQLGKHSKCNCLQFDCGVVPDLFSPESNQMLRKLRGHF